MVYARAMKKVMENFNDHRFCFSFCRFAKLNNIGTIEVGKDANFVMFDHNYNLMKTFVDGRMAFRTSLCRKKSVVSTESFDESFNM